MQNAFETAEGKRPKSEALADAINKLLQNLAIKCAKSEGIRDYYEVGVIGYGGSGIGPAFGGVLAGKDLVPISVIANNPIRVEERKKILDDGAGGLVTQVVKFPVWFEPKAHGNTPMCEALERASHLLSKWMVNHQNSFPPIVINISDGKPSDGSPEGAAHELTGLSTKDGHALLFNLHISSARQRPLEFPEHEHMLPDEYARMLFNMSSPLPEYMRNMLAQEGVNTFLSSRAFVFNADLVSVIRFLDIGTRPANFR
jgi:hypothetical protein